MIVRGTQVRHTVYLDKTGEVVRTAKVNAGNPTAGNATHKCLVKWHDGKAMPVRNDKIIVFENGKMGYRSEEKQVAYKETGGSWILDTHLSIMV